MAGGGSFWLEVLGYEINPAKYRDCAAAENVKDLFHEVYMPLFGVLLS